MWKILKQKDLRWVSVVHLKFRVWISSNSRFSSSEGSSKRSSQNSQDFFWGYIFRQNWIRISRNIISNVSKPQTKSCNNPRWNYVIHQTVVFSSISVRNIKFNDKVIRRFKHWVIINIIIIQQICHTINTFLLPGFIIKVTLWLCSYILIKPNTLMTTSFI